MGFLKNVKEFIYNVTTADHYAQYEEDATADSNDNGRYASPSQISLQNNTSTSSLNNMTRPSTSSNNAKPVAYRPGMRSQLNNDSDIQLQDYVDGHAPLPSISSIWERIDEWLDREFPELGDDMEDGATANDLNAFENDLGISLPLSFRDSFQIHDGQVSMGKTRGLIYSLPLLDLESIAAETNIWRRVYKKIEKQVTIDAAENKVGFLELQRSCPPGFLLEMYYNPNWIPFVKDNVGNNIALDLQPGPKGKWGQVILFGRDFDTKYVVASSFAEFLLNLCEDLEDGKFIIDEDEDLIYYDKLRTFSYFDVLKMRSITNAKSINKNFIVEENNSPKDTQFINSMKRNENQRSVSATPNLNSREKTFSKLSGNVLPKETLISPPVYPLNTERDFTPSKENIATNDSFVIDDDALSDAEEDTKAAPTVEVKTVEENVQKDLQGQEKVSEPIVEVEKNNKEPAEELAESKAEEPAEELAESKAEEPVEEPIESNADEVAGEPIAESLKEVKIDDEPVENVLADAIIPLEPKKCTETEGNKEADEKSEEDKATESTEEAEANREPTTAPAKTTGKKNNKKNKKKGKK